MQAQLSANWQAETLEFIHNAREQLEYAAYVADLDGVPIGSAACQVFAGLYPGVFKPEVRKQGYIWGVYVSEAQRGKGVASTLTSTCTSYLKKIGCTRVTLNASPMGKGVYEKLGFTRSNEMILELNHDKD